MIQSMRRNQGIYLFNFVKWDANEHTKLVMDEYDWQPAQQPFERTYRMFSNPMICTRMASTMKFVKFGYGRATDHTTRSGLMTRAEGVELVRKYDHANRGGGTG